MNPSSVSVLNVPFPASSAMAVEPFEGGVWLVRAGHQGSEFESGTPSCHLALSMWGRLSTTHTYYRALTILVGIPAHSDELKSP